MKLRWRGYLYLLVSLSQFYLASTEHGGEAAWRMVIGFLLMALGLVIVVGYFD